MNLHKIVECIILTWLHLASSSSHDRNQFQSDRHGFPGMHNEKSRNERKPVGSSLDDSDFSRVLTDNAYPLKENQFKHENSAKINCENSTSNTNNTSAHVLTSYIVKRPSALVIDNNNEVKRRIGTVKVNGGEWSGTMRRLLVVISSNATTTTENTKSGKTTKGLPETSTRSAAAATTTTTTTAASVQDELKNEKMINNTEMGSHLGAHCELKCSEKLVHVLCDPQKRVCVCEDKYPVQIGPTRGCEKPKQLGDQCFYAETCSFFDSNADCTQINHNAICQCKPGFHTVALRKGVKRMFCSEDIAVVSADLPTLLGVATGIAVLTGLLCFVLRLFSSNRYPATRHYGNANLSPPLLFSNDNQWISGIPLTVQGRSSSRASCQRSTTSLIQYPSGKGVHVPASRAGAARAAAILLVPCHLPESKQSVSEVIYLNNSESVDSQENESERPQCSGSRRPSLTSVHSTTSSQKSISYSARRFEQENQQREQRAAMRAAKEEAARLASLPSPSASSTENVLLLQTSTNNEEDFLCSSTTDSPAQSEPPALLLKKENTATTPSNSNGNNQ